MNIHEPTGVPPLPELSEERIDELEEALFAGIARERILQQARERREGDKRTRRRRGVWWGTVAAAGVLVAAVAIGPTLAQLGLHATGGTSSADSGVEAVPPQSPSDGFVSGGDTAGGVKDEDGAQSPVTGREIIATAQATVRVDDVAASARAIGAAADQRGGYVESMNIGSAGPLASDGTAVSGGVVEDTMPYPPTSGAWITVRVPADQLTGAIDDLSKLGTVEASSITRQDVTEQAVDMRARIDALQASVDRLTELMAKAGSVADLISAEGALSARQSELESYQQQLKSLESQVSLSSLTVSLAPQTAVVKADPAGFGDGLAAGWNGLIATLNGIVIAVGFLLPWLVVAGIAALIIWWIVRMRRRRTVAPRETTPQD